MILDEIVIVDDADGLLSCLGFILLVLLVIQMDLLMINKYDTCGQIV